MSTSIKPEKENKFEIIKQYFEIWCKDEKIDPNSEEYLLKIINEYLPNLNDDTNKSPPPSKPLNILL
jgi:hypothetical protein